jgi:hypothetical protein
MISVSLKGNQPFYWNNHWVLPFRTWDKSPWSLTTYFHEYRLCMVMPQLLKNAHATSTLLATCRMSQSISSFSSKVQAFAKLNCYFSFSASRDPGDPGEPVGPSDDAGDIVVFVESYWVLWCCMCRGNLSNIIAGYQNLDMLESWSRRQWISQCPKWLGNHSATYFGHLWSIQLPFLREWCRRAPDVQVG